MILKKTHSSTSIGRCHVWFLFRFHTVL